MERLDIDLSTVEVGFQFPAQRIRLDAPTINAYLVAVEEMAPQYHGEEALVPPAAIMALSMRALTGLLAAHPGTLHMSQRIAAHRAVAIGSEARATLTVKSRSERRGFAVLNLAVEVVVDEAVAQEGTILLMVPLSGKKAAHE